MFSKVPRQCPHIFVIMGTIVALFRSIDELMHIAVLKIYPKDIIRAHCQLLQLRLLN